MRDGFQSKTKVHKPPASTGKNPVIVLFFGGGFVSGENTMLFPTSRALAKMLGATVIASSYRLAPEHPFPTPVNDCWDSVRWIADNASTLDADLSAGFVIGGVSAGAGVAAVVTQMAVTKGMDPRITGLYLGIPMIMTTELVPEKYRELYLSWTQLPNSPGLTVADLERAQAAHNPDINSPWFCPLNAPNPHVGMPPTFLQISGGDVLRDDGLVYARLLQEHGVKTRLVVYPGAPHGYRRQKQPNIDMLEGFAWLLGKTVTDEQIQETWPIFA
ncbi:hypothetical protein ANO11243_045380 [Dothideomycetidae sp. 11243]|nr:hypothetical protein ANO11243_045380 [fungal sp. No.11243]